MATETAKFALELDDGISASSESAEDALKSLQTQIDKDSKALTQMKKAMREMQAGSSVDISAYRKLKGEIDATQNSIGKARASFINLGGDFTKLGKRKVPKPPDVEKPKGLTDMLSAANELPGPLSKVSKGIEGVRAKATALTGAMGATTAAVLGVVAALTVLVGLLAAVAAATAKATAELLKYAAAQADAMRSERLRLEGLGTLRRWMRLTAKDAAQMSESIDRVSARVPLARDQVASLGQELHRLGIRGRAAEDALEALSLAQAVQGDFGRRRIMMLIRMSGRGEEAMRDLARRVRKELGGVAGAQMRALSIIATKLGESFRALFAGVNIEPLLSGLYRLSQMFSQNTQTGRALKDILEALLEPLIGELAGAVPALQRFFEQIVIWALELTIAILDIEIAIYRAFGNRILGRMLEWATSAENIRVVLIALGLVVAPLAIGVAWLTLAAIGLVTIFVAVAWALYRIYEFGRLVIKSIRTLYETFSGLDWISVGRGALDGIVTGLRSGVERLRGAMTGLATNAMSAFRGALGIHSPSEAFARLGLEIPRGVAEGVERGSPEATGAVSSMVSTTTSVASVQSTTTNNVASIQGGQSHSVTTGEIHIHVGGEGEGAEDTARRVADALREFFDTGLATEPA